MSTSGPAERDLADEEFKWEFIFVEKRAEGKTLKRTAQSTNSPAKNINSSSLSSGMDDGDAGDGGRGMWWRFDL